MKIFFVIVTLGVLLWKAYFACLRGVHGYQKDRREHHSLWEYLLGNGATEAQAVRPFLQHALVRTFYPLLSQWRLLLILVALALLTGLVADNVSIIEALLILLGLLLAVGAGLLLAVCLYAWHKG
ncbi:MAG: ABC transporter permease [Prevotella sp.]|nr:ABC transporter permease [Prevotella sp.]